MGQIVFSKFLKCKGGGTEHIEPERKIIKQTSTMFIINYNYKVVSTSFFIFLLSHPQSSVFSRSTLVEKIPLQRSLGETGVVLGILYPESMRLCHSFIYLLEVLLQVLISDLASDYLPAPLSSSRLSVPVIILKV